MQRQKFDAFIILLAIALPACKSKLELNTRTLGRAASSLAKVLRLGMLAAKPGDEVLIIGENLRDGLEAELASVSVPVVTTSTTSATFTMPTVPPGLRDVSVRDPSGVLATLPLVADTAGDGLPIMLAEPSQICDDVTYRDGSGNTVQGTRDCASPPKTCSSDGETGCLTTAAYKAARVAAIDANDLLSGKTLAGIRGSLTLKPDCSSDGQIQCVTTVSFPSAKLADFDAWDIRKGKTIAGVAGKISFYKNSADTTSQFDRTTGDGAVAGPDPYDTIDDYNNAGSFPTDAILDWDPPGDSWVRDPSSDDGTGGGVAGNGTCDGTEDCVYQDKITGSFWAKTDTTDRDWEGSITYCEGLDYGGKDDWRLPTQKELVTAYTNGMRLNFTPLGITSGAVYWSATSYTPAVATQAWIVKLGSGFEDGDFKANLQRAVCVSP